MKVWIVDDNTVNCYVLKEMLSSMDVTAYNLPSTVLNDLIKYKPDIILIDIMMPEMNGYDLSKIIKEQFPRIRIIGITALPKTRTLLEETKICGMEHVIFKPYDMKTLLDYLEVKK